MPDIPYHIALVGNPNSGKSSLFNALTGLNQKVGNFPGVTVDKKIGICTLEPGKFPTFWFKPVSALNKEDLPLLGLPTNAI